MKSNTQKINQPVRIELSRLYVIDGHYFLNGVIFSGLAYDHRDGTLYKVYQIVEGKIIAGQNYGFLQLPPGSIKLDYDERIDLDHYDKVIYQDRRLNGILYEYGNAGFVWEESLHIDGENVERVSFYPDGSGLVSYFSANYENYTYKFKWESKQLKSVRVTKSLSSSPIHEQRFSLAINKNNEITSCDLAGDANTFGPLVTRTDSPLAVNSINELLTNYNIADEISVHIHNDINLNFFMKYVALNTTKRIEVDTQWLSLTALATLLSEMPNLQSLCFNEYGASRYELDKLDEQQRIQTRQQKKERCHALLELLFTIQAQRNCQIKLVSSYGLFVDYQLSKTGEDKLVATIDDDNNFSYLLSKLPLSHIAEIDLRQTALPLETLRKLTQFSQLKSLYIEEKDISPYELEDLDEKSKEETLRQCNARNQAVWHLMEDLQVQLHCDIKFKSASGASFKKKYES